MKDAEKVLTTLNESSQMQNLWKSYQCKFPYAADYSWTDIMWSARKLSLKAWLSVKKPSVLEMIKKPAAGHTPPDFSKKNVKRKDNLER